MATIKHLAVRCRDLAQSRAFYEIGLGFAFVGFRGTNGSMDLSDGRVNLTLLPFETQAAPPHAEGDEHMHFGILVESLQPVFDRLRRVDAPIVKEDVKRRLAYDRNTAPVGSFKALDPDGNVIDVSERPHEWRA